MLNIVAKGLNDAYREFMLRNPTFDGKIVLLGHSLGGVICYDLLKHQDSLNYDLLDSEGVPESPKFPMNATHFPVVYPRLNFATNLFFAVGSQISNVLIMRGQSSDYKLNDSIRFYNIFNIYDPLAYRFEPIIDETYAKIDPVVWKRPSKNSETMYDYLRPYFGDYSQIVTNVYVSAFSLISNQQLRRNLHFNYESLFFPSLCGPVEFSKEPKSANSDKHDTVSGDYLALDDKLSDYQLSSDSSTGAKNEGYDNDNSSLSDSSIAYKKDCEYENTKSKKRVLILEDSVFKSSKKQKSLPRYDYALTSFRDSNLHQYLLGLRAHFSYWTDPDLMYNILVAINK
jgi:hypothetical protein